MLSVRKLNGDDAAAYRAVRLRALREHPEAFGATPEQFEQRTLEQIAASLVPSPLGFALGGFLDGTLVGLAGLGRAEAEKLRHRAGVYQMYVAPEARGLGLGRLLLDAVIAEAHQLEGLEELTLAVTVGNTAAETLYRTAGFVPSHREPRYIKLDGRYYDILWMSLPLRVTGDR
jgi:GNAT superfamily N-acetyltransferase